MTTSLKTPALPISMTLVNIALLGVTLVMNWLATSLPLFGRSTGEISDSFANNLFVPAGYVFAIWGVIYLGLTTFAAYQATPAGRRSPAVQRVGFWFAVSCVANSLWIVLWHALLFPLTLLVMLVLLVSLCVIVSRLGSGRDASTADRWLVHLPFSVYLGWITVATIANASIALLSLGWDGWPLNAVNWTTILIVIGVALGATQLRGRGDYGYVAVLVWAFIGIALKQAAVEQVALIAWVAVAALLALITQTAIRRGSSRKAAA